VRIVAGGLTEEDGAAAARKLLDKRPTATRGPLDGRPTAITVFNDRCATGVLDVLIRARVEVPGEISVVGYDDSRLARLAHVNLTTIAQDTTAMTELAVSRAIARVEGTPIDRREVVVPPRLVVRGTTGPAA
jgi:DNA-binding LacI/PurR family transcriptional regulator